MAEDEERIQELQNKIRVLEQSPMEGDTDLARDYREELARLETNKEDRLTVTSENTSFELPMTGEEYEAAGSKFADPGRHPSEMGLPYWDTPGRSIAFPFTIIEGKDVGKESKISAGVAPGAVWKLKEILAAVGVPVEIVNGKPNFDGALCVGKKFMAIWTKEVDTRPVEEGGKGGNYTKATSAEAMDTKS